MPTPSIEMARAWLGRVMIDRDGDKIGEITDIYLDNETGRPEWTVVRTGLFGMRSSFVPLAQATEVADGGQVRVPYEKAQVKDAPSLDPDGQLSAAEEVQLYRHYGLDYEIVMAEGDMAGGQARAGSTGQPAEPGLDEQAGSTTAGTGEHAGTEAGRLAGSTGADQPVGTPTGGPADSGFHGELETPTGEPGMAGIDPEPETAIDEGEGGRHKTGDDVPGDTGSTESPGSDAQDGRPMGDGVSRPFVYETPGRPEGGRSTRRRQPGQVRLRRYLVTEVVTDTEAGQRHEVRVEREPIADAEVDAATATPSQGGAPAGEEQTGADDNDWFRAEGDPRR
jgi:sporulation protein YlmC with PRC-barrel domain